MNDMLIFTGGEIKALGDGKVGGFGVFFTNETQPDLDGDFFTNKTDFDLEDKLSLPIYFGHGVDPTMKKQKLGRATFKQTDEGLWVETQLDIRDRWLKRIYELIKEGKLSFSSGAISHLVERVKKGAANWVKTWPVGEVSFTPCPAAPFGTEVIALKSYDAPSLKETIRRSKLTEGQLLREESERLYARAEATLDAANGSPTPDEWASNQVRRAAASNERRTAKADWIKMRAEAKTRLADLDHLKAEFEKLIAEQTRINRTLTPQFAPGSWPTWANR